MQESGNITWLLENAGPVIKYRVANEILDEKDCEKFGRLREALLGEEHVRAWLSLLQPKFGRNDIHGAKTENYENVMEKIYDFGLRKGVRALDERTGPFLHWMGGQTRLPNVGYFPVLYRTIVSAFLVMTGYGEDPAVKDFITHRLETIYPFAKRADLSDVYVPHGSIRGFPKAFRNEPLINPELYPDDEFKLPWVHDVNAFLHAPFIMDDAQLRGKAETVIGLILRPEYQRLRPGYGVIRRESDRYYAMGWSAHLPGFLEQNVEPRDFGHLLLLIDILGRSREARRSKWFENSLSLLESYRVDGGLYNLPRNFCLRRRQGYGY